MTKSANGRQEQRREDEDQRVRSAEVRIGERLRDLGACGEPQRDLARLHETGIEADCDHRTEGDQPVRQAPRHRIEKNRHRMFPSWRRSLVFGK